MESAAKPLINGPNMYSVEEFRNFRMRLLVSAQSAEEEQGIYMKLAFNTCQFFEIFVEL